MKSFLICLALIILAAFLVAADRPAVDGQLRDQVADKIAADAEHRLQEVIERLKGDNRLLKFQLDKSLCELDAVREAKTVKDIEIEGKFPRLIVFSAPEWCAPCRDLEAQIEKLSKQTYTIGGVNHLWRENIGADDEASIQLIDCSDTDGPGMQMAGRFKVSAFPTMLRISNLGIVESRFTGVIDSDTICRYQAGKWSPPPAKPDAKTFVGGPE